MLGRIFGNRSNTEDLWASMSSLSVMFAKFKAEGVVASPRRHAGVIFEPDDSNQFLADLKSNLDEVLYVGPGATKTAVELRDDEYKDSVNLRWVILDDGNFDDLLSSTYTVANAMRHNDAGKNLLAATFHMDIVIGTPDSPVSSAPPMVEAYLIYRFDLNAYYPFVPDSDTEAGRDGALENAIAEATGDYGLKVNKVRSNWLGLWGMPF